MLESIVQSEHFFTGHSNARLTFVFGIVFGMTTMTVAGLLFFVYALSGGQLKHYDVAPFDVSKSILAEPITDLPAADNDSIAVPNEQQVFGAVTDYAVTLVQYVDYECRFCKKFFPEVSQFVSDHSATVRLIVKQYPLVQIHPQAKQAAVAATCAGQQNKLLEYSKQLFSQQEVLGTDVYTSLASDIGLDVSTFAVCQADAATLAAIEADTVEALRLGIRSQPNLIIWHNDNTKQLIDGYVGVEYLTSVLAEYL
ncbi:MAG: thioredoxin domain-containing protein [Candidatus Kerfeldbacteria bacterium]|nr:thioredoxin domain-containing protein [Candidatus Kerfeldbacteria bacterium]